MEKKIIFISRLFLPHQGGVEKHLEMLSKVLLKKGYKITIVTGQFNFDMPLEDDCHGIRIVRIPYFAVNSKRLVWTWMSEHEELFAEADLVHVHDVFWWYWPIRILQLFKPVYITFHGYEGVAPGFKIILQRKISEIVCNGSICVGDYIKKWYKANPSVVTYGAANVRGQKNAGIEKSDIAFVGRFDSDTGIDQYLEAFLKLKSSLKIDFYGAGPLERMIRLAESKKKSIRLYAWISRPETIYSKYRYIFSSQYLTILEAMQARRLVFAVYDNEIKKDYLMCHPMHDNMIIAGTASELVKKYNEIAKNPAKEKRMIDAAYIWAKEQTWEKLADQYEQLWKR